MQGYPQAGGSLTGGGWEVFFDGSGRDKSPLDARAESREAANRVPREGPCTPKNRRDSCRARETGPEPVDNSVSWLLRGTLVAPPIRAWSALPGTGAEGLYSRMRGSAG
jgi:hypothetical protein